MSNNKSSNIEDKRTIGENQDNPTFESVYMTLFRRMACEELNTVYPAIIESYDYKKQKADVSLMVTRKYKDGTDLEYPVVSDVPVVMPRTSTAMIKLPVKKGDTVLVMFSKSSLEDWLLGGKNSTVSVQNQFKMNDAIAICGMFPFGEGCQPQDEDSLEIINEGQVIKIKNDGDIEIGGSDIKKLINEEFKDTFEGHVHAHLDTKGTVASYAFTSVPSKDVIPVVPAIITDIITPSQLTSKTKAQ